MTAKHELTKLYRKKQPVTVSLSSYVMHELGLTNTLEHIVNYKGIEVPVVAKPLYKDYKHYIIEVSPGLWYYGA